MSEANQDDALTPLKEFFCGPIRATVWRNAYTDLDGRTETYNTVHVRRLYRTEDGTLEDSPYFAADDLPQLAAVTQAAYAWVAVHSEDEPVDVLAPTQTASPVLVGYTTVQGQ